MRAALTAAARNAADSGDADAADLRKLVKKQDQQKLALTIQTAKTVSHILEEPQLPAKRDLALWWPEPERLPTALQDLWADEEASYQGTRAVNLPWEPRPPDYHVPWCAKTATHLP